VNEDATPTAWHVLDREAVESRLATGPRGLSRGEVAARLRRYGPNRVEAGSSRAPRCRSRAPRAGWRTT